MLINIINHDAEKMLLVAVEQSDLRNTLKSALHFHASKLPRKPLEEEILLAVRSLLEDKHASIYFFHDGDIVITWSGPQKAVFESLSKQLYVKFCPPSALDSPMHNYYDFNAHGEDLRLLCKHKIDPFPESSKSGTKDNVLTEISPEETAQKDLLKAPGKEELKTFSDAVYARSFREKPVVLVVEDQLFSRSLMLNVLGRIYKVFSAENANEAMKLYLEYAPDIVFLDIELPGSNGHDFASLINTFDKQAFIVMVTGSNLVEDIKRAKENNVKGFIVKPYSKQKILDSIQRFVQERKTQRSAEQ